MWLLQLEQKRAEIKALSEQSRAEIQANRLQLDMAKTQQQLAASGASAAQGLEASKAKTILEMQRRVDELMGLRTKNTMDAQQRAQKMESDRLKAATELFYLGKKMKTMRDNETGSQ